MGSGSRMTPTYASPPTSTMRRSQHRVLGRFVRGLYTNLSAARLQIRLVQLISKHPVSTWRPPGNTFKLTPSLLPLAGRCAPFLPFTSVRGGIRFPSAPRVAFTRRGGSEVYQSQTHSHLRVSMLLHSDGYHWINMSLAGCFDG